MYSQTGGNLASMLGGMGSQYGGALADLGQSGAATTQAGYGQLGQIGTEEAGTLYDALMNNKDRQAQAWQYEWGGAPAAPQQSSVAGGSALGDALGGVGNAVSMYGAYQMMKD
jgi:hypothetical protein